MVRIFAVLLTIAVLTSGCFGGGPSRQEEGREGDEQTPSQDSQGNDDEVRVQAPGLEVGDWWTWEVEGRGHDAFEVTTVVARLDDDVYHLAVDERFAALPVHIFHLPPVGQVSRDDLSWRVHDEPAMLLEFPLFDGKSWEGALEGRPVEFTASTNRTGPHEVIDIEGTFLDFEGQGPRMVYDPEMGMFQQIHLHYGGSVPFSSSRVIENGTGYEGTVAVQDPQDKFLETAAGTPPSTLSSGFQAQEGKIWLVFACYLGGSTGSYEIDFITPSPTEDPLSCRYQNEDDSFSSNVQVFARSSVPGEWRVLFGVVGSGYAEAEVVGVHETVCHLGGTPDQDAC